MVNKKIILIIFILVLIGLVLTFIFIKNKEDVNESAEVIPTQLINPSINPSITPEIPGTFTNLHAYINKNIVSDVIVAIDFKYTGKTNQFIVDISLDPNFPLTKYWRFVADKPISLRASREDIDNEFPCDSTIFWRIITKNQIFSPVQKTTLYCPLIEPTQNLSVSPSASL